MLHFHLIYYRLLYMYNVYPGLSVTYEWVVKYVYCRAIKKKSAKILFD